MQDEAILTTKLKIIGLAHTKPSISQIETILSEQVSPLRCKVSDLSTEFINGDYCRANGGECGFSRPADKFG